MSGERPKPALAAGVAWLDAWSTWKSDVSNYLVAQLSTCPDVPVPPPRFARAARIAARACTAGDLPEALKVLGRADAAVERALLIRRTLPRARARGRSRVEPELSDVASEIVSTDVEVRCWNRSEWPVVTAEIDEYFVQRRRDLEGLALNYGANLNGYWCDALADFPARVAVDDPEALLILIHEATHIGVGGTEAQVQCHAVQNVEEAAVLLHASRGVARKMADLAWKNYHYWPAEYRSAACRPGAAWDETPNDGVWP